MAFIFPSLPGDDPPPPSVSVHSDLVAAYHAFRAGDHSTAARLWHGAAQVGDAQAANALGWAFDTGDGTGGPQAGAAIMCYEFSAERGWAAAECNLAVHLLYGIGIAADHARGAALLLRSARGGQEVACELLAAYLRGGAWAEAFAAAAGGAALPSPEEVLGLAERYIGVASYLRETGVDYGRWGADEPAQVLEAAAARVAAEEGEGGEPGPAAA